MNIVLYQQKECPFCKHFKRLYTKSMPEGDIVTLEGYKDPLWLERGIDYVPTVIAYDDAGREISRLGAVGMVGIRKEPWESWLNELGHH